MIKININKLQNNYGQPNSLRCEDSERNESTILGGIAVFAFINFGVKPTGLLVSLFQTLIRIISFAFPNLFKAVAASLM